METPISGTDDRGIPSRIESRACPFARGWFPIFIQHTDRANCLITLYRISRNDQTPLSGFEQDDYIENGHFNDAKLTDLIEEFNLLRKANLIFFKSLKDNAWLHTGIASDVPVSVRALAYMIVGHVTHHTNILKSKYLI